MKSMYFNDNANDDYDENETFVCTIMKMIMIIIKIMKIKYWFV